MTYDTLTHKTWDLKMQTESKMQTADCRPGKMQTEDKIKYYQ